MSEIIKPKFQNVPKSLQKHKQWLVWKAETVTKKDGSKKLTKIPHNGKNGKKASTTNPAHWCTFDEAVDAYTFQGFDGIGFVFTRNDPFVGIDLDNCFDESGELRHDAKVAVSTLNTFTERSPSGKGLHLICEGSLPGNGHCDHANGREMYQEGRFFTITADIVQGGSDIKVGGENLSILYDEWFGSSAYSDVKVDGLSIDKSAPITPLSKMPISDYAKHLIENGEGLSDFPSEDSSEGDRSAALFAVAREMVYAMVNKESILHCLTDNDNFLASAALERRKNINSAKKWLWDYTVGKVFAQYEQEKALLEDDDDIELVELDDDDEDFSDLGLGDSDDIDLSDLGLDSPKEKKTFGDQDIPYAKGEHELNARLFLKKYPIKSLNGFFYMFNGRSYSQVTEKDVEATIQESMAGRKFPMATFNNTIQIAKRFAAKDKFKPSKDYIVLRNGVLCIKGWDKGKKVSDFKLYPHNKKYNVIGELDFNYDPKATAPVYTDFVKRVYQGNELSIQLLEDYVGYCMVDDYRHQKILVMMGASRSGKGTINNNIIPWMVGKEAYGATSLTSLANSHGLQSLIGKKVGVIGEAKHGRRDLIGKSNEIMLSISGHDLVPINPKNKDEFTSQLSCRIIIACNDLPKFSDNHNALMNRYLLLPHKVSFAGKEDPMLPAKLAKEKAGMFNRFLAGLVRLGERGKFVKTDASHEEDMEVKKAQNPVGYFVDNFIERTDKKEDRVPKSEVYDEYINMANAEGCPMRERNWFGRELSNNANWIKSGKMNDDSRANCYMGIRVNKEKIRELMDDEL